ncbi:Mov34/MPN/PAD-1 family protein [Sphingobium fuliginis]|uniref:Mov34/MPN/PAD-1 family protein n=1 Tax=Sphingobium fuliginis (strain ATCC 27551) TaxID=336203 RepID=UPI00130461CC|nr:Mov34/MPN/PAD-1 family protein [Sphingobium fuliginis]
MTKVLLPKVVIEDIGAHGDRWTRGHERGGLILGFRKADALQIETVTFPEMWDHSSPTLFRRSERGHRIRALREWMRSEQTCDWLGEWHTHPGGLAAPSFIDRGSWAKLARHAKKPMTFLIFSDTDMYVGLQSGWLRSLQKLSLVEESRDALLFG